jgi:hypothetical protein
MKCELGLAARAGGIQAVINERLETVMRQNAAAGRLASGATLKMFTEECTRPLRPPSPTP